MNLTKRHLICALGLYLPLFFYYVKNKATTCVHSMWSASLLKPLLHIETSHNEFKNILKLHWISKYILRSNDLQEKFKKAMEDFNFLTDCWAVFWQYPYFFFSIFLVCPTFRGCLFHVFMGKSLAKLEFLKIAVSALKSRYNLEIGQ